MERNLHLMKKAGYDVVVVCCATEMQSAYWRRRLTASDVISDECHVYAVTEIWHSTTGAGNGLGSLHAFRLASCQAAKAGLDLEASLATGEISVALYHTAGKGTRLAPLPGAENNNKPAVKLPAMVTNLTTGKKTPISILEAVIKQTAAYAPSRKGRLSVFWGDQVFLPSKSCIYDSSLFHIDILATLAPMPTEEEWAEKELEKYGLIAVNKKNQAAQVDKVSFSTANRLLSSFGELKSVGTSLGSFSIDWPMLNAFMTEFQEEITAKTAKMDTDPHFWMPLTLDKKAYIELMTQKGQQNSEEHYLRMQNMLERFNKSIKKEDKKELFGCVDVGSDAYWWDYGQLKLYLKNNRLLTQQNNVEADCLREFLGLNHKIEDSTITDETELTNGSFALSCQINEKGKLDASVCCRVFADEIDVHGSILMNVTAPVIKAKNCVIYNITEEEELILEEGTVLAGVFLENGEKIIIKSHVETCGGQNWKNKLAHNDHSFEDIYSLNKDANVIEIAKVIREEHSKLQEQLSASN